MDPRASSDSRQSYLSTRSGHGLDSYIGSQAKDQAFKIILIGDSDVGKTMILRRLVGKKFKTNHHVTIGVEFFSFQVQLDKSTSIKLQIWDTAGQESFHSIIKSFYRNSAAVFLVYNICSRSSFEQLDRWMEEAKMLVGDDTAFVLLGNHADKEKQREVGYAEAEKFMREKNISLFFETSALDGQNIEMAFKEAGNMIYLKYVQSQLKYNAVFDDMDKISLSNCDRATISSVSNSKKKQTQASCRC